MNDIYVSTVEQIPVKLLKGIMNIKRVEAHFNGETK